MLETIQQLCRDYIWVALPFYFVLGLVNDYFWARWTANVSAKRPFIAANWSFLCYMCGLFYTLMIVDKVLLLISVYLVGSYFGTVLGVGLNAKREETHS